ncbi:MAG: carboxyltransferase domain-containing protein, partial [Actinomycetes bacterium]
MDPSVRRLGEFGLLIEHVETGRAAGLAAAIRGALPEVHEVVPGLDSVMVLDPRDDLVARVSAVLERDIPATVTTRHELKIVLDGPDLAEVLAVTGLSRAELETALEA